MTKEAVGLLHRFFHVSEDMGEVLPAEILLFQGDIRKLTHVAVRQMEQLQRTVILFFR